MSRDDEQCLKLGREVVRMIHDVNRVAKGETGYARREFTFPGGSAHVVLTNDKAVADLFETVAEGKYAMTDAVPPSQLN